MIQRKRATLMWLGLLVLVIVLAGINRLWSAPFLRTPLVDILRVCDVTVLFLFAPLALWLHWRLLGTMITNDTSMASRTVFVLGVFLLGLGFGMHEPMNALALHAVQPSELGDSIRFFDDNLGHWIFFAGFTLMLLATTWAETRAPLANPLGIGGGAVTIVAGLIAGTVVFFNMYREKTTVDLLVLGIILIASLAFWRPCRERPWRCHPLTTVTTLACFLGTVPTLIYWAFKN